MRIKSRAAAVITSAAILGGVSLAVAPSASAIPSACEYQWNDPHNAKTTTAVNLRKGPGTNYASLGLLAKGTKFTHYCIATTKGKNWAWGKVKSGANSGKTGWVYYDYLTL